MIGIKGTNTYNAREIYKRDSNYNLVPYKGNPVDIYSLGITFYAIVIIRNCFFI